jgi:hypothetical protein
MAAKTGTELRNAVKSNLGARDTGKIGSSSVDAVVMDSINHAILEITLRDDTPALEDVLSTFAVTTADYRYALPTVNDAGTTVRLKNILSVRQQLSGDDIIYPMQRIGLKMRDRYFPYTNTSLTGRPEYYSIYQGYIELYPFPDSTYNLYWRFNIWPTLFTEDTMGSSHPYGPEWDFVIEFSATASCFYKLQQIDDAKLWHVRHATEMQRVVDSSRNTPDYDLDGDMGIGFGINAGDALNPFIRSVQ